MARRLALSRWFGGGGGNPSTVSAPDELLPDNGSTLTAAAPVTPGMLRESATARPQTRGTPPRRLVFPLRQIRRSGNYIGRVEARIDVAQISKTCEQEAGTDEQGQRERDLRGGEGRQRPCPRPRTATTAVLLERRADVESGGLHRGRNPEQQCRHADSRTRTRQRAGPCRSRSRAESNRSPGAPTAQSARRPAPPPAPRRCQKGAGFP